MGTSTHAAPGPAPTVVGEPLGGGAAPRLFGRSMLYAVVLSLPMVAATVVSPVLAHALGPVGFGLVATAIALHQVLYVLATVGLDQSLILQRAEDGHDRSARGLVAVGAVLACLVTSAAAVSTPVWGPALGLGSSGSLLLLTALWTAPAAVTSLALALLLAQDRLAVYALVSILSAVGGQVGGLVLVFTVSRSAELYVAGTVTLQTVAMAVGLVIVKLRWRGLADLPVLRRAVRLGIPLMVSGLSVFVLNAGDRLILARLLGGAEVGRYQVAYTVGFVAVMLLTLVSQAWAAQIAAVREQAQRWAVVGRSRDELYRLAVPAVVGTTLAAPALLRVFAPASFLPQDLLGVVFVVVLSAFPVVAVNASARALITARLTRPLALAAVTAAVANVLLNYALIPAWGLVGSATATLLAFSLQALLQRVALRGTAPWPRTPLALQLGALAAACACGVSTLAPQEPWWVAGRFVVAVACAPWLVHQLRRARQRQGQPAAAAGLPFSHSE